MMSEYMSSWHEKGLEQGREQGRVEVALRMLEMKLKVEQIQQATELSPDRIDSLRAERRLGGSNRLAG